MPKGKFKDPIKRAQKISETKKEGAYFNCIVCGEKFWRKPYEIKNGNNKFCLKNCYFIWQKGRKRSLKFRIACSKGQNNRHKDENLITPQNKRVRNSVKYKLWREAIFERDDWTCKNCKKRSKAGSYLRIEAHHKKPFKTYPKMRFDVENGITLCKQCHDLEPKGHEIHV